MTDDTFEKTNISNNNDNIYIKTNTTLPSNTDYTFKLGNKIEYNTLVNTGDSNIKFIDSIDLYHYYSSSSDTIENNISAGDEVVLFKNGTSVTATVDMVDDYMIQFKNDTGLSGDSWGIKTKQSNYKTISNSKLDGETKIDLNSLFSTGTNKLHYKIELSSNNKTKTPVINSVEIASNKITSETVKDSDGNIITEFDKGTTNMKQEAVDTFKNVVKQLGAMKSENQKRNYVKKETDRQQFNSMVKGYMSILNEALQSDSTTKCNNLSPFGNSQVERCKELVNY